MPYDRVLIQEVYLSTGCAAICNHLLPDTRCSFTRVEWHVIHLQSTTQHRLQREVPAKTVLKRYMSCDRIPTGSHTFRGMYAIILWLFTFSRLTPVVMRSV